MATYHGRKCNAEARIKIALRSLDFDDNLLEESLLNENSELVKAILDYHRE